MANKDAPVLPILKGKRKKKVPLNPNPLFTQWLMEWKTEAEDKGWKSAHTYSKALKTLKKFPLTLETGKDCRLLQNFGEKICNMLDEKLLEYKKKNGISLLSTFSQVQEQMEKIKEPKRNDIKNTKEKNSSINGNKNFTSLHQRASLKDSHTSGIKVFSGVHEISDNSDIDQGAPPPKRPVRRSTSGGREYIPSYRSGPYALVLTLYRQTKNPDFKGYMFKAELAQAAQSLCDKSFTKPDAGSRYTAWSSVTTLIKKGYLNKISSPAKYSLTDTGVMLGQRLEQAENQMGQSLCEPEQNVNISSNGCLSSDKLENREEILLSSDDEFNEKADINFSADVLIENEDIKYSEGSPVRRRTHSLSPSPVSEIVSSKINEQKKKAQGESSSDHLKSTELFPNEILEVSDDSDSDHEKGLGHINVVIKNKSFLNDDELPDLDLPLSKRLLLAGGVTSDLLSNHYTKSYDSVTTKEAIDKKKEDTRLHSNTALEDHKDAKSLSTVSSKVNTNKLPNHTEVKYAKPRCLSDENKPTSGIITSLISDFRNGSTKSAAESSIKTNSLSNLGNSMFTLEPGNFEIILCLDNREFYGRNSSKTLLPDLIKCGIHCDLRLLHVGDILWIAREIVRPEIDRAEPRELVLNYVIERKRLDDLVKSIVDGRMKDQKCRLKYCGLSEAIILIEEYGSIQNFSISEERIKQSIVNSQIIDGFKVKMCSGSEAVVTYLATMTRFLQKHFSTKRLHAISLDHIRLLHDQQHIMKKEHYLIPFNVFNENSVKQKDLTVKEMFIKQLFQIPGISADRAKAVTNIYPTLSLLMEAYENCKDGKDKEKLLAGIKTGKTERNLGISLSRLVSLLYTQTSSLV
ncbi:Crossover junction endonuclease mus81 [Bulinus truncatus]|nr:Crossover junction endonuclease mus81 [Bulinus truncatus]